MEQKTLVVLFATPALAAMTVTRLFSSGLVLLASSRGWRLVVYAQKRIAPWISALVFTATLSSVSISASIRTLIGWAASDLTALVLDLFVAGISCAFVINHRRTIRSLIVKRGKSGHNETVVQKTIDKIANNWHMFAYAFIALNVAARLFGKGRGNFITQAILSIVLIVIAFIAAGVLGRVYDSYAARSRRRWNRRTFDDILLRTGRVLKTSVQVLIFIIVTGVCISFWGFNLLDWLRPDIGTAIMNPMMAIALVLLTATIIWISLDSWIEHALTPTDPFGRRRQQSARVKTLLPLLRNFAFVVLTGLTIIAVLANIGVNVAPLLAGAGVVGLAVGFGSQQLVQDVITGLFILLEDSIAIGDTIDTGDRSGTVEALTIRTVKIRDGDGAIHSIPFSSVKAIKNSSRDFGIYTVTVNLHPEADVDKAIDLLKQTGRDIYGDPTFSRRILSPLDIWGVDQLGPDTVVLKGSIRTLPLQQWGVGREINRRLKLQLDEHRIPLANKGLLKIDRTA